MTVPVLREQWRAFRTVEKQYITFSVVIGLLAGFSWSGDWPLFWQWLFISMAVIWFVFSVVWGVTALVVHARSTSKDRDHGET